MLVAPFLLERAMPPAAGRSAGGSTPFSRCQFAHRICRKPIDATVHARTRGPGADRGHPWLDRL